MTDKHDILAADGTLDSEKRFNTVTDEDERIQKLIAGDPNKFLHINGS